jgi:hypothetical protein
MASPARRQADVLPPEAIVFVGCVFFHQFFLFFFTLIHLDSP